MSRENPVPFAVEEIRYRVRSGASESLDAAARWFKRAHRATALRVMEEIGSWPSSEPELRALQAVWP